jgi:hypothetical protein
VALICSTATTLWCLHSRALSSEDNPRVVAGVVGSRSHTRGLEGGEALGMAGVCEGDYLWCEGMLAGAVL